MCSKIGLHCVPFLKSIINHKLQKPSQMLKEIILHSNYNTDSKNCHICFLNEHLLGPSSDMTDESKLYSGMSQSYDLYNVKSN